MSADKSRAKFLLETDILADHLVRGKNGSSVLLNLMQKGICFTTVLNAAELLLAARTKEENKYVNNVLYSLKILGLNSRYALMAPKYSVKLNSLRDVMFSVVADINKLTIVTFDIKKYSSIKLKVIHPQKI